jgi:hypothetical protein
MKRIILALVIIFMAVTAQANPFLTSNAQVGATSYQITGAPSWFPASVINAGRVGIDLANYQAGTWPLTVKACKTDSVWGVQCGPAVSYTLTCPSPTGGFVAPVMTISPTFP